MTSLTRKLGMISCSSALVMLLIWAVGKYVVFKETTELLSSTLHQRFQQGNEDWMQSIRFYDRQMTVENEKSAVSALDKADRSHDTSYHVPLDSCLAEKIGVSGNKVILSTARDSDIFVYQDQGRGNKQTGVCEILAKSPDDAHRTAEKLRYLIQEARLPIGQTFWNDAFGGQWLIFLEWEHMGASAILVLGGLASLCVYGVATGGKRVSPFLIVLPFIGLFGFLKALL